MVKEAAEVSEGQLQKLASLRQARTYGKVFEDDVGVSREGHASCLLDCGRSS